MVPQLSKEQIKVELRRMVDRFREEWRDGVYNADSAVRSAPASGLPENFLADWTDRLGKKEGEADALYTQLYRFIDEA
ncbi:hypothetical protein [Sphingomonas sp.]|uniref:hypothetical protein n=1 Tax=Sphingomonas sp. TaxID=28214 RepID=UPI0017D78248|nr:hypothetical protein [Sphingomonas sp.]MBA4760367.1 hypothetical protein [Sphingomonas sp.]